MGVAFSIRSYHRRWLGYRSAPLRELRPPRPDVRAPRRTARLAADEVRYAVSAAEPHAPLIGCSRTSCNSVR